MCCAQVVSSAIVDKYIGESARLIREMFGYAKEHQPCIIFMDEIDAIGGRRFSEGTSADREIQRTLMELLSQLDGFDVVGKVCCSSFDQLGGGGGGGFSASSGSSQSLGLRSMASCCGNQACFRGWCGHQY